VIIKNNGGDQRELNKALAVAVALVDQFGARPEDLFAADHTHEELSKGSVSVAWEGSGWDGSWAIEWPQTPAAEAVANRLGVWFEAVNSVILAIHPVEA
jgi:hypothetical protein